MPRLVDALLALGMAGEIAGGGRWVKLRGARCPVYVAETSGGTHFYTWCDDPDAREVEVYRDPTQAILAGLHRASGPPADR